MRHNPTRFFLLIIALVLAASAPLARAEWTPPDLEPPGCDAGAAGCDAPLNVSSVTQIKTGGIAAGVLRTFTDLIVDNALLVTGPGSIDGGLTVTGTATSTIIRTTSTTASSTFANGINLTKGCFAINGTCIAGSGVGGGSTQWSSSGANIYFAGGSVGVSDAYSFGSASSSALAYYLPYNANATNPKAEISFRSTGTTGLGTFNIGGYYNMGAGWNYRNFLAFNHNGLYPFIDINQPTVFNSDALFSEGTTINASAADALVAPPVIYDGNITNYITVGDSNAIMNLYGAAGMTLDSGGTVNISKQSGGLISVGNGVVITPAVGQHTQFSRGNVGLGVAVPTEQLELTGNIKLPATTASAGQIKSGTNLLFHTYGTNNLFAGVGAGNLTTSGTGRNTGIGRAAMANIAAGNSNTAIGYAAGQNLTSGGTNVFIGANVGAAIQTGSGNTLVGYGAGAAAGAGSANLTAFGLDALGQNSSGADNVAVGRRAARLNGSGSGITALGAFALDADTSGTRNTAIGYSALYAVNGGTNNIALGYRAGDSLTAGSNNIAIGYDVDLPVDTGSNQLTIGNLIFGTGVDGTSKTLSSGKVGVGVAAPSQKLEVNGGIRYNTATAKPACDAAVRGTTWFTQAAGGSKDTFEVCAKDAGDAYAWRLLY